jgi:hypothetical protein
MPHPGGRPPKYTDAEEFQRMVDEYFEYIKGEVVKKVATDGSIVEVTRSAEPPTITGMAYYLGFMSRSSFYEYEQEGEFSDVCKRARMRVEARYEANLSGTTPTGSIFALKNMGWADRSLVDTTSGGKPLSNVVQVEVVHTKHNAPQEPAPNNEG